MADIFVFGDSIGYGAWDERGGWVDRLKQYFHAQKLAQPKSNATEVYNLSVDGDTSEDVAKRVKAELSARLRSWSSENDLVLISIGTNDSYAKGSPDQFRRTSQEFLSSLKIIGTEVQTLRKKLAFISLDPVDESRTNPASWVANYWTNDRIQEFNQTLQAYCDEQNLPFLDLFKTQLDLPNFAEQMFDGAHPNTQGHEWLYEHIKPFVLELLK